jgi:hypothetical protein
MYKISNGETDTRDRGEMFGVLKGNEIGKRDEG